MSGILYDPPDHGTPDAAPLLAGLRNGAWLDAQNFPPLAYAVPGVVPEGSVLLVGPPKIGKSWFVLTVALAAATGGRALSIAVPRRPTLYLALEDGNRRLQDRCRKLLGGDPIPREFEYLIRVEGPVIDTIAAWLDRHHDVPPPGDPRHPRQGHATRRARRDKLRARLSRRGPPSSGSPTSTPA
jgi:hypothetical protein